MRFSLCDINVTRIIGWFPAFSLLFFCIVHMLFQLFIWISLLMFFASGNMVNRWEEKEASDWRALSFVLSLVMVQHLIFFLMLILNKWTQFMPAYLYFKFWSRDFFLIILQTIFGCPIIIWSSILFLFIFSTTNS